MGVMLQYERDGDAGAMTLKSRQRHQLLKLSFRLVWRDLPPFKVGFLRLEACRCGPSCHWSIQAAIEFDAMAAFCSCFLQGPISQQSIVSEENVVIL